MSSTLRIRQIHRWLSIIFTITVLVNIAAMMREEPALWIGLLALFPLILLLLTGLVLFALPYLAGAQRSRAADHG